MGRDDVWDLLITGTLEEQLNLLSRTLSSSRRFRSINGYFDNRNPLVREISKRMDSNFKLGFDPESGRAVSPCTHRLVIDGHTIWRSWKIALDTASQFRVSKPAAVSAWVLAYLQDAVSPAGVPLFEFSRKIYFRLRDAGVSEELARNVTTINGEKSVKSLLTLLLLPAALLYTYRARKPGCGALIDGLAHSLMQGRPASLFLSTIGLAVHFRNTQGRPRQLRSDVGVPLSLKLGDAAIARLGTAGMIPGVTMLIVAKLLDAKQQGPCART